MYGLKEKVPQFSQKNYNTNNPRMFVIFYIIKNKFHNGVKTLLIICFDGHVYSLKLLRSSVFVSFTLASATELPAGLLVTLILDRWGRRFCGFLTLGAISACSFAELYLPSILFLPETAGRELPQTLQQGEDFSKGDHFWSFPCCNKIDVDRHRNGNNNCTIER
ncbi:Protein of unknown function [Cotesia congregata]|uniref:Uncharacterized protein n=1 Tax=Cotesia congregata TaxID=51543 RepID=A0A8J2HSY7_COTCN|nr:Protein of unknown function [Cotesia congregata]